MSIHNFMTDTELRALAPSRELLTGHVTKGINLRSKKKKKKGINQGRRSLEAHNQERAS